jgi:MFS family permease
MSEAIPAKGGPPRGLGREFHKLWAASTLSNLGDGIALVAAPLLAATLTRDPTLVAGLSFAQRIPWLLFALFSGALADRIDRRRAMAAVGVFRATLIGILGVAVVLDLVTLPLLYAVFFLLSTGETLFDTASAAMLPAVAPREELPAANARLAGTMTITNQFMGPPLGGFLFAVAASLPFLLGSGGIVLAAALILALRGSFHPVRQDGKPPTALLSEIREGMRWLWGHSLLRTLALTLAVLNIPLVAQVSIMVLFAQERLGVGPAGYGILIAMYGVGGILGSVAARRVIGRLGAGRTLRVAVIIEAATPAAIALTSEPIVVGAVLAFFGFHAIVWGALLSSLRQELTPDHLRGRVESVYRFIELGGAAPGALLGGLLAAQWGLTAPFWFGAIVGIILIPFVWSTFSEAKVVSARQAASG